MTLAGVLSRARDRVRDETFTAPLHLPGAASVNPPYYPLTNPWSPSGSLVTATRDLFVSGDPCNTNEYSKHRNIKVIVQSFESLKDAVCTLTKSRT
jgi:hypothetical protein